MTGVPLPPSILFITIDCLRADHVGCLGYGRDITPAIDRLARESLVFSRAMVAGSPTYNSFPALLAGRYPLALGRDVVGLAPGETTLASHLQELGYRTGALIAGNPYVSRWMGYDQGFAYFEDFLKSATSSSVSASAPGHAEEQITMWRGLNRAIRGLTGRSAILQAIYQEFYFAYGLWAVGRRHCGDYYALLNKHPRANAITAEAINWLASGSEPFFLWLHYMDAHRPYCPPEEALKRLGRADLSPKKMFKLRNIWLRNDLSVKRLLRHREDFLALYGACIFAIDSQLGRLLDTLGDRGCLEHTIIVLTADHGEAFLEHGERDHHPTLATQELINVPLFIRLPGGQQAARQVALPFSHIDLLPTILDMAGLGCPSAFVGQSRWPALKNGQPWHDPAITEMVYGHDLSPKGRFTSPGFRLLAATDERYKLVINFAKGSEELFDLDRDPNEQQGLFPSANPAAARRLLRALQSHLDRSLHNRHSSPELRMRLRKIQQLILEPTSLEKMP